MKPATGISILLIGIGAIIAYGGFTGYLPFMLAALINPNMIKPTQPPSFIQKVGSNSLSDLGLYEPGKAPLIGRMPVL